MKQSGTSETVRPNPSKKSLCGASTGPGLGITSPWYHSEALTPVPVPKDRATWRWTDVRGDKIYYRFEGGPKQTLFVSYEFAGIKSLSFEEEIDVFHSLSRKLIRAKFDSGGSLFSY